MSKRTKKKPEENSFLSDDLVVQILNKVDGINDRKSFSEVCKQWYKVEGLSRTSLHIPSHRPYYSVRALSARFPNVVKFQIYELKSDTELKMIVELFPLIEVITLFNVSSHLGREGLGALGIGCAKLSSVSLIGDKISDAGVALLVKSARNLMSLALKYSAVGDIGLGGIGSSSISSLTLRGCRKITDRGLDLLAKGLSSRTIKKLVVSMCNGITSTGVEHLQRMPCLEHLELCGEISDVGGVAISKIQTLKTLILALYSASNITVVALAENCHNLELLELQGCPRVSGSGIRAFSNHKCLKQLVLIGVRVRNLHPSDVETVALGCPSLESVVVSSYLKTDPNWRIWSSDLMHIKMGIVVKFGGP